MDGEGTSRIHGNPLKKILMSHHLVRSLYIKDVRKDAAVIVNLKNRVFRALLVALIVSKTCVCGRIVVILKRL